MGSSPARLTIAAATVCAFFLLWAGIAAHPWASKARGVADPRVVALDRREQALKRRAAKVNAIVARRWATYRTELARRRQAIAVAERRHVQDLQAAYTAAVSAAAVASAQAAAVRTVAAPAQAPRASGTTAKTAAAAPAPPATPSPSPAPAAAPAVVAAAPPVVVAPPATPAVTVTRSS